MELKKKKKKKKKSWKEWEWRFYRRVFLSLIGLAAWPIWDFLGFEMEISVVVWAF